MMKENALPLPWKKALLAVIPGLLAAAGLVKNDFSARMMIGFLFLTLFLFYAYWGNNKKLAGWSLMASGMLASIVLSLVSGVFGGLAAVITTRFANTALLFILLIILLVLLGISVRKQHIPRIAWILMILIIICQLAVRIKYFVQFGVTWPVAGQWLKISLFAAVSGLLLPVVLGSLMVKRYGPLTILFVTGMVYVNFQMLIDVNFKVSDQIGGTLAFGLYKILIPFLITVAAILWYLRVPSPHKRISGMLILIGSAVVIDLLVVGWAYAGELPQLIWISFIPYTISILLTFLLAHLLCQNIGKAQSGL